MDRQASFMGKPPAMKNGRMSGELSTLIMATENQDLFAATAGNVNTSGLLLLGVAHWNTISLVHLEKPPEMDLLLDSPDPLLLSL